MALDDRVIIDVSKKFLLPSADKPRIRWGQLYGSAMGLKLAEAAQTLNAPLLVIAANARELSRLEDELRVFLPASIELLSTKVGTVLVFLGSFHFIVLFGLAGSRKQASAEERMKHWRKLTHETSGADDKNLPTLGSADPS